MRGPLYVREPELVAAIRKRERQVRLGQPKAKRRTRRHPEQDEQRKLVTALDWLTVKPARFWAVPNGGWRSGKEAAIFQGIGVRAGVSDLHFAWLNVVPCFGVIEMKAPGGDEDDLTEDQALFLRDMQAIGHFAAVEDDADHALATLAGWGYPLRTARLQASV